MMAIEVCFWSSCVSQSVTKLYKAPSSTDLEEKKDE
jgi:hypothetical protein